MNVEHRTSNIERRILMALRFIDPKIRKPKMRQSVRYLPIGCEFRVEQLTSGLSPIEFRKGVSFSALVANLRRGLAQ